MSEKIFVLTVVENPHRIIKSDIIEIDVGFANFIKKVGKIPLNMGIVINKPYLEKLSKEFNK